MNQTATPPATSNAPAGAQKSAVVTAPPPSPSRGARTSLLVGLDLGTNKSCVLAGPAQGTDISLSKIIPTVVGYAKEGLVEGIITQNVQILFGDDALQHLQHVNLVAPLANGLIAHREPARDFLKHIRSLVDPSGKADIRAVIGIPANAGEPAREDVRQAVSGLFDRVILIPEPFLAALGFRDDARLGQPGYVDPVVNSLFIDIGGGTTDLCLVQGYFPGPEDQISIPFAGDAIDQLLAEEIARTYPHTGLSVHKVRELKEAHAYVGPSRKPIDAKVIIGGKARELEIGDSIGNACNSLLDRIMESVRTLISRASSDTVAVLLQNIVVTGGGSLIKGIDTVLQQRLADEGYVSPKVRVAGADYKRYVAVGALKAARAAKENQWQHVLN